MLSRALLTVTAEGSQLGMLTLTLPHSLLTPPAALAEALHEGIKAVSKKLKNYATARAHELRAFASHIAKHPDDYRTPEEVAERFAAIEEEIRANTLLWLAPPPEITVGGSGLHPHYHLLLICPPALQSAPWWKGEKIDDYWRLQAIERDLYEVWTAAALPVLRAADPGGHYAAPLQALQDEVSRASARVRELDQTPPGPKRKRALDGAVTDLESARSAADPKSPETTALRGRCVQAVRWSGAAAAAAHYTWGAASEIGGAAKRCDLWRCLDTDATAHLWGAWVEGAKGRRLTRSSRGLMAYLESRAEDCPADVLPPAAPPPRVEVQAHAHPFVLRWARDCGLVESLKAALAAHLLPQWLARHLPPKLRPLVELRPDLPPVEDYQDPSDPMRDEAAARILRASENLNTIGYWASPDGSIASLHRPDPCEKRALARRIVNEHASFAGLAKLTRGLPVETVKSMSIHKAYQALYQAADRAAGVVP